MPGTLNLYLCMFLLCVTGAVSAAGAHPPGRGRHILPFHDVLLRI